MAVVRGDYEISEEKLSRFIESPVLRLASDSELKSVRLVAGFLSPIGINFDEPEKRIMLVVDDTIVRSSNLVFGANEEDYHLKNVNYGRDFYTENVADISLPREADICLQCGGKLKETKAVEVGHIFKLGDRYSRNMNLFYQDDNGRKKYVHIGCYGIGIGRLLYAVVEANHDKRGIVWPPDVSPYKVYLIAIGKSNTVKKAAETLYSNIKDETLYDDRNESPGVKFADSDLLGFPLRVVVSSRNLSKNLIEISVRKTGKVTLVQKDRAAEEILSILDSIIG